MDIGEQRIWVLDRTVDSVENGRRYRTMGWCENVFVVFSGSNWVHKYRNATKNARWQLHDSVTAVEIFYAQKIVFEIDMDICQRLLYFSLLL